MQVNGANPSTQAVYFDDANFTVVPEPSSPLLLGLGAACLSGVFTRARKRPEISHEAVNA